MDATFLWISGIAVSAALAFVIWLVKDNTKRATEKLQSELEALGASKEQLEKINEAQATPLPDAVAANSLVRKLRAKAK
jgi:hypothetical protein